MFISYVIQQNNFLRLGIWWRHELWVSNILNFGLKLQEQKNL